MIVGHPYETEELFLDTVQTCLDIGFSKIHVFPYSKRDGTPASKMPMQVDNTEKKRRSRELNQLSKELEQSFYQKHINEVMEVLIEEVYENESIGHTSNYIKVKVNQPLKKNDMYRIHLTDLESDYLVGEVKEKVSL